MTEVLSQDEIDQLLTAICAGNDEPEDHRPARDSRKIKIYDFRRPDKFSKEQIRTISIMHETFARLTTTTLSTQLRSMVHVHVASVDQLTYEEFIRSIPTPTTLAIINLDPLRGNAILEIDPAITFSIIDRICGGRGEGNKCQHEMTDIEQSLMEGIIIRLLADVREAWTTVIDLRPRLGQIDTNPQFAQIVPPTEMVVLVTLETKVGDVEGLMNICIPYIAIESIMGKLSATYWYHGNRAGRDENTVVDIINHIDEMSTTIVAEVGRVDVPVRDILAIKPGDVFKLPVKQNSDLLVRVEGRPKFACRPGISGANKAMQIVNKINYFQGDDYGEQQEDGCGE